jgi:hypothetical protein
MPTSTPAKIWPPSLEKTDRRLISLEKPTQPTQYSLAKRFPDARKEPDQTSSGSFFRPTNCRILSTSELRRPDAVIKERPFADRLRTLPIDWLSGQSVSIGEMIDAEDDLPPRVTERCVARSTVRSCHARCGRTCVLSDWSARDVGVIFSLLLASSGGSGGGSGGAKRNPVVTVAEIAVLLAALLAGVGARVRGLRSALAASWHLPRS